MTHGHFYEEVALKPFSTFDSPTSSGNESSSPSDYTSLGTSSSSSYTYYSSSYTPAPTTSSSTTTTSYAGDSASSVDSSPSPVCTSPPVYASLPPTSIPDIDSPLIFEGGDFQFSPDRRKVSDNGSVRLYGRVFFLEGRVFREPSTVIQLVDILP